MRIADSSNSRAVDENFIIAQFTFFIALKGSVTLSNKWILYPSFTQSNKWIVHFVVVNHFLLSVRFGFPLETVVLSMGNGKRRRLARCCMWHLLCLECVS